MHKYTLWKDAFQAITRTWGRFVSIFLLMTVSAFAFIGLKMTGPDMRQVATDFYQSHRLADLTVTSTTGLNQFDQKLLQKQAGTSQVEGGYFKDSMIKGHSEALRIFSNTKELSTYQLMGGHMPNNTQEISIDYLLKSHYPLGSEIHLTQNHALKYRSYKVVGYVKSSEYLDRNDFGATLVGDGSLDGYAVVSKTNFKKQPWTIARISLKSSANLNPYNPKYDDNVDYHQSKIERALNHNQRVKKKQLTNQIDQAKHRLKFGTKNSRSIVQDKSLMRQAIPQLEILKKQSYTVNSRDANPGYENFLSNSKRVDILSNVFPVFLFMIAALVSLTTMTRFVEEERINIGTLKSLGYSNYDVAKKFVLYGMLSSTAGVAVGGYLGYQFLPYLIFKSYSTNSTLSGFKPQFQGIWLLIALVVAIACTTVSSLLVLNRDLRTKPAQLLLPKPPKHGSRILLERIKPLWKNMSFNYKVTARNIFRYKVRMLMTIIGVAGCTGLLVMGFGIRDSLKSIGQRQYGELIRYDLLVVNNSAATSNQKLQEKQILNSNKVANHTKIHFQELHRELGDDQSQQTISLIVPPSQKILNQYMHLVRRENHQSVKLTDHGVVISEKLAKLTQTKVGDQIRLKDGDHHWQSFKVSGITEMYMGHFMLMNRKAYKQYFKQVPASNANLVNLKQNDSKTISEKLMKTGAVAAINRNQNNQQIIDSMMQSLNQVIGILIGMAILLAMVVIYNLTTINVEERIRELSTIKVLGFYDREVTLYIYRETIFLSVIGVLVGYLMGYGLHHFIITSLPPVNAMFDPQMHWGNFIISGCIPMAVTLIMAWFVFRKIKKVNMLDALQSVD